MDESGSLARSRHGVSGSVPRGGVTGISIDTRTLEPGDLFFAIKGERMTDTIMSRAPSKAAPRRRSSTRRMREELRPLGPLYSWSRIRCARWSGWASPRARVRRRRSSR